ncbi:MAG: RluA family pseudouridine synthase [Alistipes sp.]|nr:RluA family pseudouridine synthase [Alistipes sp.]
MRELRIKPNEAGQRFDKFLKKYLDRAPSGFIYKMLRKKNITLNEKRAEGGEILNENDIVRLFFSEETLEKFHGGAPAYQPSAVFPVLPDGITVLYEDEDILLINKPAGVLSQKAKPSDISVNEIMIDYLVNHGTISIEEFSTFKPSVCNRLDRNTSGIVTFGKTRKGVLMLSGGFRDRLFEKYYLCVVKGVIRKAEVMDGFLVKDDKTNRVSIEKQPREGAEYILTEYIPVCDNGRFTFLKVRLHTGRTHQIRAHLSSTGHPVAGDFKYGDKRLNEELRRRYGISSQLLHAYELVIPKKKLDIKAPIPEKMEDFLKGEHLWVSGKQEV